MPNTETLTIRVSKENKKVINHYAQIHGVTMAELMKSATIEKIEDELDLEIYKKAMAEYRKDEKKYSVDEAERILSI